MTDNEVEDPETLVSVGQEIEVKVLRVDAEDRKIGLSLKRVDWSPEQEAKAKAEEEGSLESPEDLKGGLGGGGPLFQVPTEEEAETVDDQGDAADSPVEPDEQADEESETGSTEEEAEATAEAEEEAEEEPTAEAEEEPTAEAEEEAEEEATAEEEGAEASDDEDEDSAESNDSEEA